MDDDEPVAALLNLVEAVGGEENRSSAAAEIGEEGEQVAGPEDIEGVGRFVEDQARWIVDEGPVPGKYVLTGSQQFGLLSGITQSLAGRVGLVELLVYLRLRPPP